MDEQEAVTQVEPTTDTESAPVETTSEPSVETPASVSTEPETSSSVPYERFKEINDKYRDLEEQVSRIQAQQAPTPQYQAPSADPDTDSYVDARAEQKAKVIYERNEEARFDSKHAKEFDKDKLLRAAYILEVQDLMSKGRYVDRETALEQAKEVVEGRAKPIVAAAKQEGLKEGQDIAKTKQQLGAIGETGKQPELDDSKLSADEFAKKYNIPRA
jgi:hypothetical protein